MQYQTYTNSYTTTICTMKEEEINSSYNPP